MHLSQTFGARTHLPHWAKKYMGMPKSHPVCSGDTSSNHYSTWQAWTVPFVRCTTSVTYISDCEVMEKHGASTTYRLTPPSQLSWERICLQCRRPGFNSWVGKIPWRREGLPTPIFWPREFHGLYSPRSCKESDTTEPLSHTLSIKYKPGFFIYTYFYLFIYLFDCAGS